MRSARCPTLSSVREVTVMEGVVRRRNDAKCIATN